jgi:hypothetical protein
MMILKFKSSEEHHDLLHKVKKMEKFAAEVADMLEECYEEDDLDYRGGSYRKEYDEEDMRHMDGRYTYRRGGRRM